MVVVLLPVIPVNTPVVIFIVAFAVALLYHCPGLTASVKVIVCPAHTLLGPLIAAKG